MKKDGQELKIEYWAIGRAKPYGKNARVHPPEQIAALVKNIQGTRFMKPILVDERGEILAGHGAHMAAKQMGMERIPVIQHKGLTQAQKRAYRLADNKIGERSSWDGALVGLEIKDLQEMGVDLALTGWEPNEVELLLKPPPGRTEEPPTPAVQGKAVSRLGDLWMLGEHRLLCADSTKPASLTTLMGGAQAQCVFTDPPYGISYEAPSGAHAILKGDELRRGELAKMLHGAFSAALPHVRQDAGWYVWHASATREEFSKAMRDVGLVELSTIIWAKPGQVLGWSDYRWSHEPCFYAARQGVKPAFHGDRTGTTVWRLSARSAAGEALTAIGQGLILTGREGGELFVSTVAPKGKKVRHVHADTPVLLQASGGPTDDLWEVSRDAGHGKENQAHPTQKPVELARRAIANSAREGEVVLDLFAGASSTIMGAEQTGRMGYALELEPRYVDVGVRRWQAFTGKEAIHATEKRTFDAIAKSRGGAKEGKAKARAT